MQRCEIRHPSVGEHLVDLQELINSLEAREQIPQIEVAVGDQATALVFRHLQPLSAADEQALATATRWLPDLPAAQRTGNGTLHLSAAAATVLRASGFRHPRHVWPAGFFIQVNQPLNRLMVQRALELLDLQATDHVLDLFCGLGNFTCPGTAGSTGHRCGRGSCDGAACTAGRREPMASATPIIMPVT
ncbi:MAG: hypothetical protein R3E89_11950 [Thiolinea sp.]